MYNNKRDFLFRLCPNPRLIFAYKIRRNTLLNARFRTGQDLGQCKVNIVLGHRSGGDMPSLISPLQSVINALINGQLVAPSRFARLACIL